MAATRRPSGPFGLASAPHGGKTGSWNLSGRIGSILLLAAAAIFGVDGWLADAVRWCARHLVDAVAWVVSKGSPSAGAAIHADGVWILAGGIILLWALMWLPRVKGVMGRTMALLGMTIPALVTPGHGVSPIPAEGGHVAEAMTQGSVSLALAAATPLGVLTVQTVGLICLLLGLGLLYWDEVYQRVSK